VWQFCEAQLAVALMPGVAGWQTLCDYPTADSHCCFHGRRATRKVTTRVKLTSNAQPHLVSSQIHVTVFLCAPVHLKQPLRDLLTDVGARKPTPEFQEEK
jgi:hypothetical protein